MGSRFRPPGSRPASSGRPILVRERQARMPLERGQELRHAVGGQPRSAGHAFERCGPADVHAGAQCQAGAERQRRSRGRRSRPGGGARCAWTSASIMRRVWSRWRAERDPSVGTRDRAIAPTRHASTASGSSGSPSALQASRIAESRCSSPSVDASRTGAGWRPSRAAPRGMPADIRPRACTLREGCVRARAGRDPAVRDGAP